MLIIKSLHLINLHFWTYRKSVGENATQLNGLERARFKCQATNRRLFVASPLAADMPHSQSHSHCVTFFPTDSQAKERLFTCLEAHQLYLV